MYRATPTTPSNLFSFEIRQVNATFKSEMDNASLVS